MANEFDEETGIRIAEKIMKDSGKGILIVGSCSQSLPKTVLTEALTKKLSGLQLIMVDYPDIIAVQKLVEPMTEVQRIANHLEKLSLAINKANKKESYTTRHQRKRKTYRWKRKK